MNELDQLPTLDPARDWRPSAAERARADAMVERLIAEPVTPAVHLSFPVRRVLLASGAAAALAAGVIVLPPLWPGGGAVASAYAAWATPGAMPAKEALAMANECAAGWGPDWGTAPVASDIVLAETRNKGSVLLVAKGEDLVHCLSLDEKDGVGGADLLSASSPPPGAAKVTVESMGASGNSRLAAWTSDVVGRADKDVSGVDVVMSDGESVHASVRDGWWVAWWPGHEAGEADGVSIAVHSQGETKTYLPSQLSTEE